MTLSVKGHQSVATISDNEAFLAGHKGGQFRVMITEGGAQEYTGC